MSLKSHCKTGFTAAKWVRSLRNGRSSLGKAASNSVQCDPPEPMGAARGTSKCPFFLAFWLRAAICSSSVHCRTIVPVRNFRNNYEQIAINRPFYGECGFPFCFRRCMGVSVRRHVDRRVAQKLLCEFQIAGLRVYEARSRVSEGMKPRHSRSPPNAQPKRVRAGMRRAKLEGRQIGRAPLDIDRAQAVADGRSGMSLTQVAKKYRVSRATVCRLVNESDGLKLNTGHQEKAVLLADASELAGGHLACQSESNQALGPIPGAPPESHQ
jgi:hypothetical protein